MRGSKEGKASGFATTAECTAALGISKTRLNLLARQGKIPRGPEAGQWDIEACRVALANNLSLSQAASAHRGVPEVDAQHPAQGSFAEAQLRKMRAQARMDEVRAKQLEGSVVEIQKVNQWISGMILRCREIFERIPEELSDRLALLSDPLAVQEVLRNEIRRGLTSLSEYHV